jgi:hypothetical protein
MVNSGLRFTAAEDLARRRQFNYKINDAHFRHESCVNQPPPRAQARSEVVLATAILGLLRIWGAANPAVGS